MPTWTSPRSSRPARASRRTQRALRAEEGAGHRRRRRRGAAPPAASRARSPTSRRPPPQVAAAPGGAVAAAAPARRRRRAGRRRQPHRELQPQLRRRPRGLGDPPAARHGQAPHRRGRAAQSRGPARAASARSQRSKQLVKGAVGFDQARGDVVAITARAFAPPPRRPRRAGGKPAGSRWSPATSPRSRSSLCSIFGVGRPLLQQGSARARQARRRPARRPRPRSAARSPRRSPTSARADLDVKVTLEMIEATRDYEARAALIRNFVRQDPARAASSCAT